MDFGQLQQRWDELLILIGAIGVACEGTIAALAVLVRALRGLAGWLASIAVYTGTDADDRAIAAAIRVLDRCASGLDAAGAWIPRLRVGRGAKPVDPRGSTALAVLLAAGVALSGCGASGVTLTRDIAAGGMLGVVAVDPVIAGAYDRLTEQCDAGELGETECDERLRRLDRAERALRSLASSLTAVDLALGAYEDGRDCGVRPAIDGAVQAAREVVAALDAAGLDVPPLVIGVLELGAVFVDAPECDGAPVRPEGPPQRADLGAIGKRGSSREMAWNDAGLSRSPAGLPGSGSSMAEAAS